MNNLKQNSCAILGIQLGDEGKGRIVDNKLQELSLNKNLSKIYVVRSQGGNNAGHTVEKDDIRIGLHQLPSGIFYKNVIEVLDSGMVINVGDLLTEITLAEKVAGKLSDRIILSEDAMLCTDLQRAKEVLNRIIAGNAKGGTGRGIGPTTAEFYDKTGLFVKDLIRNDWETTFSKKYTQFKKTFEAFESDLETTDVPDFEATKTGGKATNRKVGTKSEFLSRLSSERAELIKLNIVKDTFMLHTEIYNDASTGILFEMAQAVGLDPWFGTRPDRTTTPTTIFGVSYGTRYWRQQDIQEVIGIMKATYCSSVGVRVMPTQVDNEWASWVRDVAHEYGTTTGRPRDICYIDLPFLKYNIRMSGINKIALTHLDIARRATSIKVCTHYELEDRNIGYKPDMSYLKSVTPKYIEFPSWDIADVMGVSDYGKLPNEAKEYIKFLERELELPMVMVTTGPKRKDVINL